MQAGTILAAARRLLKDPAGVRWANADLLAWLSAGQRQVVNVRPDASAKRDTVTLVEGIEQEIPADGFKLLSVLDNINDDGTRGRPITLTNRDELNMTRPGWNAETPALTIRHYLYDPDVPRTYEVWPPAEENVTVRIAYAVMPPPLTQLTDELVVPDTYEGALVDYVCMRANMEDTDDPKAPQRATDHLTLFTQAIGAKTQADEAAKPKRK